jgi:hypothetical protein
MFILHTSFQLYHCKFPKNYLQDIYDTGFSNTKVNLECTPMYDLRDPEERGQWCDIFVALVECLRSGESKVQWLSESHPPENSETDIRIGRGSMRQRFWRM